MCFGNMQTTQQTSQTSTPPAWLSGAAQNNVNFATNLQSNGFTPYSGQMVANFSPQQQQSFGLGGQLAGSVSPYVPEAGGLISNYANAGPQSVTPQTIASQMSPYMNQYVSQALAPQVSNLNNQLALQSQLTQGQATSAGAFGDPRATMLQQNQNAANSLQEQGLVGNAYNAAFNTAIGAGAQDVANNLNAQTTNANLAETALGRQLTGANALIGAGTGATNLVNTLGGQQTAQSQAGLNALYNQWQMAQQYPFLTTQLVNSTLGAARGAVPMSSTSTTQAPNNAGWGLLGAGMPAIGQAIGSGISGLGGMLGIGGGAAGGAAAGGDAMASVAPELAMLALADGGTPPVGQPSLVGERGPELFVPGEKGVVIPHEVLQAAIEKRRQAGVKTPLSADGLARALGVAA